MKRLNRECGEYLADLVHAEPRKCWHNAFTGATLPTWSAPGPIYVEGWLVISPGIAIEHGWVETETEIIDPTLWHDENLTAECYFAGVRYDRAALRAILATSRRGLTLPVVWGSGSGARRFRHGWGGMEHAGYRQARDDAYRSIGFPSPSDPRFFDQMAARLSGVERKVASDGAA